MLFVASLTSAKVCCSLECTSVEASIIPIVFPSWFSIGLAKQDNFPCESKKCSLPETMESLFRVTTCPNPFVPPISSLQIEPGITIFPTSVLRQVLS